ncbi:MAG: MFS transporter [Methanobacteriota archaeon]|nr:MAG: MFS transporter [Euryarchaeota archaeon]
MDRYREVVVYIAGFTGPLAGNMVLALLGTLGSEWNVESVDVLLSIPAFMFPFALVQLVSGAISNAYDRRSTVLLGLSVYAIGTVLASASGSLEFFIGARVVQGLGYAFVNPILVAMLSDIAGPNRQGQVMGYFGSSTTAGVSVGPLLGGAFADINWRFAFLTVTALSIAMIALVWFLFRGERRGDRRLSLSAVFSDISGAVRHRRISRLSASGFLAFMAFAGVISFVAEYMETGPLALGPEEVGIALSVSGFVGIFVAPLAGRLVDRRGAICCVTVGFLTSAIGAFALSFADEYLHFLVLLLITGSGGAFIWASLLTMVVAVPPSMKNTSSSVFNSSRFLGYAISPLVFAPIYLATGFDQLMILCASIGLVALLLVFLSRDGPKEE